MDPNIPTQSVQNEIPVAQPNLQQPVNKIPFSGNKLKWILLIVIFLIFAFGGTTYYLGVKQVKQITPTPSIVQSSPTTTPDSTANWQTYTNTQYGFEIKYPEKYLLSDKQEKQPFYNFELSKVVVFSSQENYLDGFSFSVYVDNGSSNLSLCLKDDNNVDLTKTKEINGNKFYIYWDKLQDAAMGGVRGSQSQYRIIHNNYCYILDAAINWSEVGYAGVMNNGKSDATPQETQAQKIAISKQEDVFYKMLSTFKFTDQTTQITSTSNSITNWKTYIDSDFGISFLYPDSLYSVVVSKTFPYGINPPKFTDDLRTVPEITIKNIQPKGINDMGPIRMEKLIDTTIDAFLEKNELSEKEKGPGSYIAVSSYNISKITFQGFPAYLLKIKANSQVPSNLYLVQVGKEVYLISFDTDYPVTDDPAYKQINSQFDADVKPIIEKVLTSIKFLN